MAQDLGELALRITIAGQEKVRTGLQQVGHELREAGERSEKFAEGLERTELPALALLSTIGFLVGGVRELIGALGEFTGVSEAAGYQKLTAQLTFLTGSAREAKEMIADLKETALGLGMNPLALAGYTRVLLNTGSSAREAARQIKALADVSAMGGMGEANIGEAANLLGQIREKPHLRAQAITRLSELGINLRDIVKAQTGHEMSSMQAVSFLGAMRGEKLLETLIGGIEKTYGNAAKTLSDTTALGILQQIGANLQDVLEPTGEMLLPILQDFGAYVKDASEKIRNFNELTGGSAGLTVVMFGLYKAGGLIVGSFVRAGMAIKQLTTAIDRLAVSAYRASLKTGEGEALKDAAGAAGFLPFGGGGKAGFNPDALQAIPKFGGLRNAFKVGGLRAAGEVGLDFAKGLLPKLGRFAKGAGPLMLLTIGSELLGDKIGGKGGNVLKNVGEYAGYGALIGTIIPGIGTAVGAGVGALVGAVKGLWENAHQKSVDGQNEVAKNTKKAADALQDIRGHLIGGGARSEFGKSRAEAEMALQRMLAYGVG